MTPKEMREVLLEEARWWTDQPKHAESAARWVTYFEQLPEDDPMLALLAPEYVPSHIHPFTVWNMYCTILQKGPWTGTSPPT
jgi:hypothetical protein